MLEKTDRQSQPITTLMKPSLKPSAQQEAISTLLLGITFVTGKELVRTDYVPAPRDEATLMSGPRLNIEFELC